MNDSAGDPSKRSFEAERQRDDQGTGRRKWDRAGGYYDNRIRQALRTIVEPSRRVLEIRCDGGELLAAVEPSYGLGVDINEETVRAARRRHPELRFLCERPENLELGETFDYIIFSHIHDTEDVLRVLERLRAHCHRDTRIILRSYNLLWQPLMRAASRLGLCSPISDPNWLSEHDLTALLELTGFDPLRNHRLLLVPVGLPLVATLCNGLLARLPGLRRLCLVMLMVTRPEPQPRDEQSVSVSVVVPCHNEQEYIEQTVQRIPDMGKHTEIVFCDDRSTDKTRAEIERAMQGYPERDIKLITGPGICKADNVWTGFRASRGDILMILDGDLTVMPEELPYFFRALVSGRGEFINGSRLVYPIDREAMKFTNRAGNWLFALAYSHLLGQRIKDTLCGTKVLWRKDWVRLEKSLGFWGHKDLWGDHELLLGAAKLHLRIQEVPVHYRERVFGVTKMTRVFANGWRMLRIWLRAWHRLPG